MYCTLLCSTVAEVAPLIASRNAKEVSKNELYVYATSEEHRVDIVISGSGMQPMTYRYARYLSSFAQPDVVIQAGIAGAFDRSLPIGAVLEIESEVFADTGAEDQDGSFLDMFELGLWEKGKFPFEADGRILNPALRFPDLPKASALTVNTVSGTQQRIDGLQKRFNTQLETMEGAAFFYNSLMQKVAFSQVRSVSNYVEPRNRDAWDIPTAVKNLNDFLMFVLP